MPNVSNKDVISIVHSLKNSSPGWDGLPAFVAKGSARPEVRGTAEPTWRSLSPMKSAPSYVLTSIILTKRGPTGRDR